MLESIIKLIKMTEEWAYDELMVKELGLNRYSDGGR